MQQNKALVNDGNFWCKQKISASTRWPTRHLPYFRMPWSNPQLDLTSVWFDHIKQGPLTFLQTCVSHTRIMAEHQSKVLVTADKRYQMKPWNHGKYSVFKEVNVCDLQRRHRWIWSPGGLHSHSPGTCSLHRPQSCSAPFQSSCWINKIKHPQRAAPKAAMPSHMFHLWFLPPENVSDSQQGGLSEQPKHSIGSPAPTERRKRIILK